MLDFTGSLRGPPAETLSTGILRRPLGPPALLDLIIFTTLVKQGSEARRTTNACPATLPPFWLRSAAARQWEPSFRARTGCSAAGRADVPVAAILGAVRDVELIVR
jgi:hypothetical protein